ncbi:MAG: type II secretion system protein M [Candidatus Riflebacteria bacterium]|nr:type II secretion system protein M [Candidatus Riflebacteria bacterium]
MVRVKPLTILLIVANLAVFFAAGLISFDGNVLAIQQECQELENKLPQLQELHEWVKAAKASIDGPPAADSGQLLGRWNQMAARLGLEISEAAQIAGSVPEIKLAGTGAFNSISMILNNMASEKAALIKRLRFEKIDKGSWEFEVMVAVRNGPWEYLPTQEKRPAPETPANDITALNSGRPFAAQATSPVRTPVIKEQIRYIGYFSGDEVPAVIIEVAGKFAVLKCGDTTPGGSVIKTANIEEIQLVSKDNAGKETTWTVKMEKK